MTTGRINQVCKIATATACIRCESSRHAIHQTVGFRAGGRALRSSASFLRSSPILHPGSHQQRLLTARVRPWLAVDTHDVHQDYHHTQRVIDHHSTKTLSFSQAHIKTTGTLHSNPQGPDSSEGSVYKALSIDRQSQQTQHHFNRKLQQSKLQSTKPWHKHGLSLKAPPS